MAKIDSLKEKKVFDLNVVLGFSALLIIVVGFYKFSKDILKLIEK
jgi:hypothetical protein